MAETLPGTNDSVSEHNENYPDPTGDSNEPYPALSSSSRISKAYNGQSKPDQQYAKLADHLNVWQAHVPSLHSNSHVDSTIDSGVEGLPMPNTFLNLHPVGPQPPSPNDIQAEDSDDDVLEQAGIVLDTESLDASGSTRGRGRGGVKGSGRGRGRRGWKWALKGTEHDPNFSREPKPRGRPRGSVQVRGRRRKGLDPGRDFKEKQIRATKALLDGDYEDALTFARESVQANPEIWAAHSLLSEALQSLGRERDSIGALLSGANVARDANTWMLVAERTLEFAGEDRTDESLQQAVFCYSQAIELEKQPERNIAARMAKMSIWLELGEYSKARRDCKQLTAFVPDDIELARQLADLCAMTGDVYEISSARTTYEHALEATYPEAHLIPAHELDSAWNHLNILMELVDRVDHATDTIGVLKRWARRFLGRSGEQFWDSWQEDDREFDVDHERREEVDEFRQGLASHDAAKYGEGLPLELRVKLGLYRLKASATDRPEAMRHLKQLAVYKDDITSLYDMFYMVATALLNSKEAEAAIEFFEPILQINDVVTDEYWVQYGHALGAASRFEEAADCFRQAIEHNPTHIDARVALAKLYQDNLKDNEKAFAIVDEIIALNRKELLRRENLLVRPRRARAGNRRNKRQLQDVDSSDASDGMDNSDPDEDGSLHDGTLGGPVQASKRRRTDYANSPVEIDPDGIEGDEDTERATLVAKKAANRERRAQRKRALAEEQAELKRERQKARAERQSAKQRSREMMESMADQVSDYFDVVRQLWPMLEEGTDEGTIEEWTEAAMALYDAFRNVKQFYPTRDKHIKFRGFERMEAGEAKFMNEMETWRKELELQQTGRKEGGDKDFQELYQIPQAPENDLPKEFCGIPFVDWHHVFVDLALLYARRTDQAACYEVIDDGLYGANVFYHDANLLNTTQATSLSCAFIFNDSERLCFAARWFINKSDFRHASGFQLLSAVNRLSYGGNMWFSAGPTQKHMLRTIKALDYHAFDPNTRTRFDWGMQGPGLKNRLQRIGEPYGELDGNALLTYGHMVGIANHSQSALPYFLRAYALQPENATVNLSIAITYIQNAMKRQTDNRQYGIAQGLSFLQRYQDIRTASGAASDLQEVAYNTGRVWHMLGLTHLAVPSYEEALALSEAVQEEFYAERPDTEQNAEDFSKEAALALVNLLAVAGNDEAAKQIVEEHLVL